MKIYTRKGDEGNTSLTNGDLVSKSNARIKAYGDVDELNSFIGLAITGIDPVLASILTSIQKDLFAIGAQLADPKYDERQKTKQKTEVSDKKIKEFEELMDKFDNELEPLRAFILPGGTKKAAMLHVCRTVSRRAERTVVELTTSGENVSPVILKYLNRLSDLLFTMARVQNKKDGNKDSLWT